MKRKRIVISIACVAALLFLGILKVSAPRIEAWLFGDAPTEIEGGFSDELLLCLKEQYGIAIPEDAVFVKGYNTNAFRDPSLIVLFRFSLETVIKDDFQLAQYVHNLLSLAEETYSSSSASDYEFLTEEKWYEECGGEMQHGFINKEMPFTWISYEVIEDEVYIRIIGHHPRGSFV